MGKLLSNIYCWGLLVYSLLFGSATYRVFIDIFECNITFLSVSSMNAPLDIEIQLSMLCALFFLAALFLTVRSNIAEKFGEDIYMKLFIALVPFAGFIPVILLPASFASLIIYTAVISLSVYRLMILFPPGCLLKEIDRRSAMVLLTVPTLLFIFQGYMLQLKAFENMSLFYGDWAEYLLIGKNTADGEWFMTSSTLPKSNFLSTHFSPGSLLIMAAYLKIFCSVKAFFLMSSIILYIPGPLAYLLGRTVKLSRISSLVMAYAVLLSPSLLNLSLCTFNGFHPIYMMVATLIVFFIFLERNWIIPALLVFIFSLTIKETVAVFWVGMGAVIFITGRKKTGAGICLFSIAYYFIVMRLILPAIAGDNEYDYASRFSHLGNSEWQIMLSPLMRPAAFFGSLFRPQCVYFFLMLLIPAFILTMHRWIIACGAGITLMFVCLQNSDQLQSICMQYQSEAVALMYIAAILGAGALAAGKGGTKFLGLLAKGVRHGKRICHRRALLASLPAVLASASFASFFLGENYFTGRASIVDKVKSYPVRPSIAEMKKIIPVGASLTATTHAKAQFILRNELYPFDKIHGDYILIDIFEPYQDRLKMDLFRAKLLQSDIYPLVYSNLERDHHFMLFKKMDKPVGRPDYQKYASLSELDEAVWKELPGETKTYLNSSIEIKKAIIQGKNGLTLEIAVRLLRKVDYDIQLRVILSNGRSMMKVNKCFGNGFKPAFECSPGTVYQMHLAMPLSLNITETDVICLFRK